MISRIFIERPKLAMVISIVIMFAGYLCMQYIPVAEYPELAPPTISVWASYPGASSEEIANTIASPLEQEMNGLENMMYFQSESNNSGSYQLSIKFKPGTNADTAQVDVQNAVKRAEAFLPEETRKLGVDIMERSGDMLGVFVFSKPGASREDIVAIGNFLRGNVRDELARIDGISQVEIMGASEYSMRVWLNPDKMSAMNITPEEVQTAIRNQNIQAAAGNVGAEGASNVLQYKVNAQGRLKTADEFKNIIIRMESSTARLVRLSDIGEVELGSENYSWSALNNGEPAIMMALYRNSDANAIEVIDAAKAKLQELEKFFPEGLEYHMGYDPTQYIRSTMEEIWVTLAVTLLLVVAITYLFLQNWRATLIPALTIPVSILGAFIFLYPLGFSMNLLTMFALILVIGSLVDDAIVVVENTIRILDTENLSPKEATIKSMHEITGAIIATTLVVVAIYAPIAFYGGMVGTIYMQFSVTMCVALCFSTLNALTLSPALCALLLKKTEKPKWDFFKPFNILLEGSRKIYLGVVKLLVRRMIITALLFGGVLAANYFLFEQTNTSFIPDEDKGALFVALEQSQGATLNETETAIKDVTARVIDVPGIKEVTAVAGFSFFGGMGENLGLCIVALDDWEKRGTPETQIGKINETVTALTSSMPGSNVRVVQPPAIMGLGVAGGVTFMLQAREGQSPQELEAAANQLMMALNKEKEIFQIAFTTYNASTPQLYLDVNREKALAMGIPPSRIFSTLTTQLASTYVNDFNLDGFTFKVKIQSMPEYRSALNTIDQLTVMNNEGKPVPVSSFATIRSTLGPRVVTRFNQYISASFQANAVPGVSSQEAMLYIEDYVDKNLPGYKVEWTDLSLQERQNDGKVLTLMMLALAFAYLFLVGQYESWTMPLTVILSVAFGSLGALLGLKYFGMPLSIYAQLGVIMLVGLTGKNAILMAEFSKQAREERGLGVYDAALDGASLRYRAVLMTAWSYIIGVFPMVIATGAGAGSRLAIGHTTFWGMLLATLVGIAFVPSIWALFEYIRCKTLRRKTD